MSFLYIFDLDGTLADISHRQHMVGALPGGKTDWPAFYEACFQVADGKF